jgi:predicted acyltransferase
MYRDWGHNVRGDTAHVRPLETAPADINIRLLSDRLLFLDTYRGLAMLLMVSEGFGILQVAQNYPNNRVWQFLAHEVDHVRWQGCSLWDLIMPAFLLIVGVAIPYSIASRRRLGQSSARIVAHALWRSLVLTALGVFLMWYGSAYTDINFINVLAQIGLGYWIVVLLARLPLGGQVAACAMILAGYWFWFLMYPLPGPAFDYSAIGVPSNWRHPEGIAAHWDLNTNPAAAFDRWLLNLFPRDKPFAFRAGGGTTLNFVPAIATMLIGVMAGEWLRSARDKYATLRGLVFAGVILLVAGISLDPAILPGIESTRWSLCPIVKRLWTPSYVVYSAGWVLLFGALLYWIVEIHKARRWTLPFIVVGMNSIVIYLLAALAGPWLRTLLVAATENAFGDWSWSPILAAVGVLVIFWFACLALYRRRIFVRL